MTRIIRIRDVIAQTGQSRSSIYEKVAARAFPRPVSIGTKAVGWVDDEVDAWIKDRIAQRDAAT